MIKFGTSGWRGIIAQDFTFENERLATQAKEYVQEEFTPEAARRKLASFYDAMEAKATGARA